MFGSVWTYFFIFFFEFSWLQSGGEMPEIPRDTLPNQTAPLRALQPDGCFSKPPLNSEPSNHLQIPSTQRWNHIPAWLLQAEVWWRAWISRAPLHSPAALQMQLKWLKAAVAAVAFWSRERRSCQTLFVLDAVKVCGAKHKLGTH